jgi:hypothetical protein
MLELKEVFWVGIPPSNCDITGEGLSREFIDGKTKNGPWAIMSPTTWSKYGCGRLGVGFGQRYVRQLDGRFKKVEG